jgi:hypothetical protein
VIKRIQISPSATSSENPMSQFVYVPFNQNWFQRVIVRKCLVLNSRQFRFRFECEWRKGFARRERMIRRVIRIWIWMSKGKYSDLREWMEITEQEKIGKVLEFQIEWKPHRSVGSIELRVCQLSEGNALEDIKKLVVKQWLQWHLRQKAHSHLM